jgi:hypothetical protein
MWRRRKQWSPEDVVARQLAMNPKTWAAVQDHGLTEETEIRLDFAYDAPDADAAEQLAAFLRDETDCDVRADVRAVTGSTQSTTVSASILDEWVRWMVLAGYENGRCRFDGWGAAVP